jgi:hypothetical protein
MAAMKRLRYFIGYIAILGLCAAVIGILTAFSPHETEAFGGGNGSESNPWLITNVSELQDVNLDLTAHYKLANDINASETSEWNSGAGFVPIAGGGTANKFNGGFDGDGHTITGLYINRPLTANVGLFGHVGDNTAATVIKEVGLINTSIVGARGTGTLIGRVTGNANTLIEHCSSVNGSVTGDGATGGLIGSHNSWRETPGGTDNPVLRYSWANISVSYSGTGAGDKFGGLVGCSQKGTISNCYARGNVTHSGPGERIGGLAGCIDYRGELFDSYSTGLVTVAANCTKYGGLVGNREGKGNNIGVVTNCFWDTETSNQSSSAGGTGKTTEQMKNESTFANATWNFDDIWTIDAQNDGYPRLIWTDVVVIPILTINGSFTANDKVYDGTNAATGNTSGLALNGSLTRGTNVNLTDVVIVFNNSSVGAGKTVYITSAALNGSDAGNYSLSLVGAPTATANISYMLNTSSTAGGNVTTPGEPGPYYYYTENQSVNIVATPDACYHFVNWTGTGAAAIANTSAASTNITMNASYSVTANFAIDTFTLNTSSTAGGNVSVPGEGTPIGTYNCSEAVTITAANDSCYYFVDWTGDTGNISDVNSANTSISMYGNYSIQANFALYQYNLNYSAGAGGSLTGNTSQTVNCGSNGSAVNAVPDACYYFVNWSDSSTDNPRTDTNVTDNISVIANFAAYQYTLNTSSTAGGNVSAPGEGTPIGTYNCSEAVTINASPDGGYYFVDWTGDTGNISDVNSANTSISMYGNYSIQANFINVMHNLSTGSTAGGNVTAPGEGNYSYGDGHVVNITATPDTCYHFVNWTGDTGNVSDVNSANTSITMYGDYSITANFAISQYTLNYSAGAGGIINGTSLQTVNCSENGSTVEAVPDACYYFVNWSDSSTQNPRTDTHVTDNVSVTANFAIYQYNLNTSSTAGGNVTAPGESGPYNYNCSEVVAITAVNDSCYYFVNWTGSGVNAGMVADPNAASTTINMSNNASVQANFAMTTYDIDVTQAANGVIVPGDVTVNCGSNQSFNITANDCYIISSVIVDGTDYPVDPLEHATNASVHFNGIDAAHNLSAIFIMDSYMINASAGANGNISPPGATVVNCSDSQEYTITPDACYHVVDVEADGSSVGAVTSYIFNDVRADHTINATFAIDQYTLTYIAGSGGTINGTTPQTVNCGENGSAVEAVANTCYVFVRWNDSVLDNPRTDINVSENLTVSAVFGYICGGGGYIPPSPTISINVFDDTSTHPTDGNGVLQQDADAVSPDGKIAIHVPAGTSALDADGNPLTEINVDTIDSYPAPPDDRIVIAAFDFHPDGAIFNPAIQITLTYDPAALPAGADESGLSIAYYNEASNEWECVSGTVNPDTNTITFSITHFTVFVIVASCESAAAPTETPAPTPTVTPTPEATIEPTPTPTVAPTPTISPSPTPTPPASCLCDGKNRWICILLTVTGGILLAGLIGAIIRRKRKR